MCFASRLSKVSPDGVFVLNVQIELLKPLIFFYSWLGMLEKTLWLQHLSGLLAAAVTVCHAIEKKGRPVLVHCSDGWDRTPQIVATAQLCLDPYYRTVEVIKPVKKKSDHYIQ